MSDFAAHFSLPADGVWLNTAHQGALPRVAAEAAHLAIEWKLSPRELTAERFRGVPARLRAALGRVVGVPADDIILANSSSYGLHLLANGWPWRRGDEVLLVGGDFPSTILPWLDLDKRGVRVETIRPAGPVVQPEEVAARIGPATRLFCTTWVHSMTGQVIDADAIGTICRARGVAFVMNGSQGIGARRLDAAAADAITGVGFKWLCGPYGTGFCWIRPALRDRLEYNQNYWLARQTADDLGSEREMPEGGAAGARRYDLFGTANFFNFTAWTAALELLLEIGIDRIAAHDDGLVQRLIDGLDRRAWRLESPAAGPLRSTLVTLSHREPDRNREIHRCLGAAGVGIAYRRGRLRFSPHLYNRPADIDAALEALARAAF